VDYGRPGRGDRLAAEYVLGTLRGAARRRFERLLAVHPSLRRAVVAWQERLAPMSDVVEPVVPPPHVWAAIERRLFGQPAAPGLWHRIGLWRLTTSLATAAVVVLAVLVSRVPEPKAPLLVVLASQDVLTTPVKAAFVASISGDGAVLVLEPLERPELNAAQALELWAVPAKGVPRSLGLVRAAGSTTVRRNALLDDTAALAVSLEPPRGSPTGQPTGPIVSVGKIRL